MGLLPALGDKVINCGLDVVQRRPHFVREEMTAGQAIVFDAHVTSQIVRSS